MLAINQRWISRARGLFLHINILLVTAWRHVTESLWWAHYTVTVGDFCQEEKSNINIEAIQKFFDALVLNFCGRVALCVSTPLKYITEPRLRQNYHHRDTSRQAQHTARVVGLKKQNKLRQPMPGTSDVWIIFAGIESPLPPRGLADKNSSGDRLSLPPHAQPPVEKRSCRVLWRQTKENNQILTISLRPGAEVTKTQAGFPFVSRRRQINVGSSVIVILSSRRLYRCVCTVCVCVCVCVCKFINTEVRGETEGTWAAGWGDVNREELLLN